MLSLPHVSAALAWLALVARAAGADAPGNASLVDGVFRYGFSECLNNQRTLFYYADQTATCADAAKAETVIVKPPVHGLRCDIVCDKGYYLGANFTGEVPVSGCEKCPRGKYSLGGGKLFSQRTNAWSNPLPIDIHTECVTRNLYTDAWQANCRAWEASEDGSMVSSGSNSEISSRYTAARLFSSLRISATFVREGTVTFQYRVSAEMFSDGLVFSVDDKTVMPMVSRSEGWEEAVFKIQKGAHTFAWDYTKDFVGDSGDDKAFIRVIEFVGTAFSDTYCHPCGSDVTLTGGSLCAFCKENHYAAPKSDSELDYACYKCPKDTHAPKGSIGVESCISRRACSMEDVLATYSECEHGARDVSYEWSQPSTCDHELPDSIDLPASKTGQECGACQTGFFVTQANDCARCALGEFLSSTGCKKCPAGRIAVNTLEFGNGAGDGWSDWPSVVDKDAAIDAGWKLTHVGISFAAKNVHRPNPSTRFPLPFNASFDHLGFLNITYRLKNVPVSDSGSALAWLELEMETNATKKAGKSDSDNDDFADVNGDGVKEQIIHLQNGASNGTFSELIQVNVTKAVTKQFRLVLRTSSGHAEKRVHATVLRMQFQGTTEGASISCGTCPEGYEVVVGMGQNTCRVCPAGTFLSDKNSCEKCPSGTVSSPGASKCDACGHFTASKNESKVCAVSSVVEVNSTNGKVAYDIELLQSLVWGNASVAMDNDLHNLLSDNMISAATFLDTKPVVPLQSFKVSESTIVYGGLFRPLDPKWKEQVKGTIAEELVNTDEDLPYAVFLTVANAKDAGGFFKQSTSRYGDVQCKVPEQWKVLSGGNRMAIEPMINGSGLIVKYTNGSPCKGNRQATTSVHFICDMKAGEIVAPSSASVDNDGCAVAIEWKTALACPICDASYFNELKSSCSGGKQSISYESKRACYGGQRPDAIPVSACSDLVLDSKALYTAYAAIAIVAVLVALMIGVIMVLLRKYRNAYNDYMYLKGKMPTTKVDMADGSKESTFEFTPKAMGLQDSPGDNLGQDTPRQDSDDKDSDAEDDDDDVETIDIQSA